MDIKLNVYQNTCDGYWLNGDFSQSFRLSHGEVVEFRAVSVYCKDSVIYEDKEYPEWDTLFSFQWKALEDGLYTIKSVLVGSENIEVEIYKGSNEQVLSIWGGLSQ